ncbi:YqcI/YcgG family protein [Burkholderia singularis]|nr:YqcI/YcgG family protein [Burkholderia singularis]
MGKISFQTDHLATSPHVSSGRVNQLLTARELCHGTPLWAIDPVMNFVKKFSNSDHHFPCNFAHQVYDGNMLRAAFFEENSNEDAMIENLGSVLTKYIETARGLGKITSFLAFFKLDDSLKTVEEYETWFWSILQRLHDSDQKEWPFDIPQNPYDPNWAFSFGGQAFFIVCFTPAHITRKSRYCEKPLIIFQPRWIFDGLEGDTPAGIAVRQAIRDAVAVYDNMPASKKLTSYGEGLDWEQYFLPDVNQSAYDKCPMIFKDMAQTK